MASVHGSQSKISNCGGTRDSGKQILVEEETSSRWEVENRRSKTRCGVTWSAMLEPNTTISTSQISILVFMNLCSIVDVT